MIKFVFATVAALTFSHAVFAEILTKEVIYSHDGVEMKGMLAYDGAIQEARPGILVVHEWWGQNEYPRERARKLAALGYTALAVDMYGTARPRYIRMTRVDLPARSMAICH